MKFDATVDQAGTLLTRQITQEFKSVLRAKLMAEATKIVEETAEELAKDLMMRVDTMYSNGAQDPFGSIRMVLRIGEKEKQFTVEKSVKQV